MADLPIVLSLTGRVNTSPADLRAALVAYVQANNPGATLNLPGSLLEDITSTDVGALVTQDQALTEFINSLTPYGANAFLLNQLGQIYGVQQGVGFNTAVFVVFSGTPGFVIPQGFTVGDGTYQYTVQDGGIIGGSGATPLLYCVATVSGSWAVAAGTVTELVTSVPGTISLAVTNPLAGIPSTGTQTEEDYRAQVLTAGLAASQGMPRYLKTLLSEVPGVQSRLVSVLQQPGGGWLIIVGGGDPYQVAYAIYTALFDISTLVGSTINVTGVTNANPGVVTTDLTHGLITGQTCQINGLNGILGINGVSLIASVLTPNSFSIGIDTTSSGAWTSGGVVTPNIRNLIVTITDPPNSYQIPYVTPPQQSVSMTITWNTSSPNIVSPVAVAQLGAAAIADYVNSVPGGQPMNLYEMQAIFAASISTVVLPQYLTRMLFAVSIDGVGVLPDAGSGVIQGDPQSYLSTTSSAITIVQG